MAGEVEVLEDASATAELIQNATALIGFNKGRGNGKGKGRFPIRHSNMSRGAEETHGV